MDADLEAAVRRKIAAQINAEARKLELEGSKSFSLGRVLEGFLKQLPMAALAVTAIIGVLSYIDSIDGAKRNRLEVLATKLTNVSSMSNADNRSNALATLASIRREFASDPEFAFQAVVLAMPLYSLKSSEEQVRLYAARVISEAISKVSDKDEFYRLSALILERTKLASEEPELSPLLVQYTAYVTCAMTERAVTLGVSSAIQGGSCKVWESGRPF